MCSSDPNDLIRAPLGVHVHGAVGRSEDDAPHPGVRRRADDVPGPFHGHRHELLHVSQNRQSSKLAKHASKRSSRSEQSRGGGLTGSLETGEATWKTPLQPLKAARRLS